jgi:quinol monooxygenase YgiN
MVITFIAQLRVQQQNAKAFEALMSHVVEMTRAHEPGVAFYDFSKCADEPDIYVVVEVYRDAKAQAAHMATEWVIQSLPKSAALIEGRPHIRQYVNGDSEPVRRTVASD